eukprot:143581_1
MLSLFISVITIPFIVSSTSTPRFVTYVDKVEGWWPDSNILKAWGVPGFTAPYSYNVINLAFLTSGTASDALAPWVDPTKYFSASTMENITGLTNPTDDQFRSSLKQLYSSINVKLMVSCFGASDYPTGSDPVAMGKQIASFVTKYELDGADIDWEDSAAFNSGDGKGEYWLANLTSTMRANLPSSSIITHAPQAPYFMGSQQYAAGGYLYVDDVVGDDIDWYNVQFYNQGSSDYTTFNTLFVSSDGWATKSSVYQMILGDNDLGIKISSDKIVVGKPVTQGDADNTGYVTANNLKTIFSEAITKSNG